MCTIAYLCSPISVLAHRPIHRCCSQIFWYSRALPVPTLKKWKEKCESEKTINFFLLAVHWRWKFTRMRIKKKYLLLRHPIHLPFLKKLEIYSFKRCTQKQFHKNKYFLVKKKRILISMVRETGFISTFVYSSVVRNKQYEKYFS